MATSLQISPRVYALHQAPLPDALPLPVDTLYVPRPSDAYVPPLDIVRRLAREDLAAQQGANIHDPMAMVRAAVTLEIRLRQLLDALDADDRRCPVCSRSFEDCTCTGVTR